MDWTSIILSVVGAGGILYLVIEKLFSRRKDKADAKGAEIDNAHGVAALYTEIDAIVQGKTAPIEAKLDRAIREIEGLKKWRCTRRDCAQRTMLEEDEA